MRRARSTGINARKTKGTRKRMYAESKIGGKGAFKTLRRFAPRQASAEQCEFCSAVLGAPHRHLIEVATRKILCVCHLCALRFENVVGPRKLIPRDARALPEIEISDAERRVYLSLVLENDPGKDLGLMRQPGHRFF